jgi:hypothetical protein
MAAAVASSAAATYVAPIAAVSDPTETLSQDSPPPAGAATTSAAASVPASPTLSAGMVAALLAQQSADQATAATAAANAPGPATQVTIPQAVLDNMQAFATTSPTPYTDQIGADAATLADSSKASDTDKAQAWVSLTKLLSTGAVYKAGNVSDLQAALDATETTAYAKHAEAVSDQMNAMEWRMATPSITAGTATNAGQNQLTALNQFSPADQQILLATMSGGGFGGSYASVGAWKAALQQQSAAYDAQGSTGSTQSTDAGGATAGSSPASTSAAAASTADIGTQIALKTLTKIAQDIRDGSDAGVLSLFSAAQATSQSSAVPAAASPQT